MVIIQIGSRASTPKICNPGDRVSSRKRRIAKISDLVTLPFEPVKRMMPLHIHRLLASELLHTDITRQCNDERDRQCGPRPKPVFSHLRHYCQGGRPRDSSGCLKCETRKCGALGPELMTEFGLSVATHSSSADAAISEPIDLIRSSGSLDQARQPTKWLSMVK